MANKRTVMSFAAKFGFVLDEVNTGMSGNGYAIIFDHPTHSVCNDCRSISVYEDSAANAWKEAYNRLTAESQHLAKCTDADCNYHCTVAYY